MRDEFYFPSKDGNTEIHTVEWKPEGEVKGILQLCHGMVEYIERYDEFANYMCERGYYVIGNDHLGHGKSVQSASEYGYFHKKYGNSCLLTDMHTVYERARRKYPDAPYFLLGHSMGSIMARQYIQMYGNELKGALIIGVVQEQPAAVLHLGRLMCRVIGLIKGDHYRSQIVNNMVMGSFNKAFKPARTRADWVTGDDEKLDAYCADPLCSFTFTVNGYFHMFGGMLRMEKKENLFMIPKDLPILFASGEQDPCGGFGKGVKKVYKKYKASGIKDVTLRLYKDDRHELLNETDRAQVMEDFFRWIDARA